MREFKDLVKVKEGISKKTERMIQIEKKMNSIIQVLKKGGIKINRDRADQYVIPKQNKDDIVIVLNVSMTG